MIENRLLITEEKLKEITHWKVCYQRLKKRIEETRGVDTGGVTFFVHEELQKILEGKNA